MNFRPAIANALLATDSLVQPTIVNTLFDIGVITNKINNKRKN
jgi:hypothetical protein